MLTVLGPDKWAASFVCTFKGQVKLLNDVVWISSVNLLESIETVEVEGIDASSMVLFPVGLDNLSELICYQTVLYFYCTVNDNFKNIVKKGEQAGKHHFLLL